MACHHSFTHFLCVVWHLYFHEANVHLQEAMVVDMGQALGVDTVVQAGGKEAIMIMAITAHQPIKGIHVSCSSD